MGKIKKHHINKPLCQFLILVLVALIMVVFSSCDSKKEFNIKISSISPYLHQISTTYYTDKESNTKNHIILQEYDKFFILLSDKSLFIDSDTFTTTPFWWKMLFFDKKLLIGDSLVFTRYEFLNLSDDTNLKNTHFFSQLYIFKTTKIDIQNNDSIFYFQHDFYDFPFKRNLKQKHQIMYLTLNTPPELTISLFFNYNTASKSFKYIKHQWHRKDTENFSYLPY